MLDFSLKYNNPLFRPPSEAYSLIFQITLGCSWNKCAFCEMYRMKEFTIREYQDIVQEIQGTAPHFQGVKKIFLADGDALAVPTDTLLSVLNEIHKSFPGLQRISAYALPKNINRKSEEELKEIRQAGLKLVYVGIESGNNEILKRIRKGETASSTIKGLLKAKNAGIKSSVMIINGLGGKNYQEDHAVDSAVVLNETQPEFASTLVLYFPLGQERYISVFGNDYIQSEQNDLFYEMKILLENSKLNSTIFRSDHASNYLILKGVLNRDKEKLLKRIETALSEPENVALRPEYRRGL